MSDRIGFIKRVNGPVVTARGVESAGMMDLVEVGEFRLVGEIVRLDGTEAVIQVYEDTTGVKPGDPVYGAGKAMSLELGPGLLGTIFDGIQRPLTAIRAVSGCYLERGVHLPPLDRKKKWKFDPVVRAGDRIAPGATVGTVRESETVLHRIMVPPDREPGTVRDIVPAGEYDIEAVLANVESGTAAYEIRMVQSWPVRRARPVAGRSEANLPLITGQRVIDTLFPLLKGGTAVVPGGFGTGKTIVQYQLAKWSDVDIIVYIGCGERGNEMTDVLLSFPELVDPRTNQALMNRTVLIANVSNMPVAAREASIYTGITIAEYYRDMGYAVAVLADSTSRWAEALRELSSRMEEMPAEEGFPSYLPTRLAQFYERAGAVTTLGGAAGSVSVIGAVSPPGGDFSEPVTQHSRRFVRCFWALDRQLANSRHYPAVSWTDSYSEYLETAGVWWNSTVDPRWSGFRTEIMGLLQDEIRIQQVVRLIGPDSLPENQKLVLETARIFKNVFLQQNSYDVNDRYSLPAKQFKMLEAIVGFHRRCAELVRQGWDMDRIRKLDVYTSVLRMKFKATNQDLAAIDSVIAAVAGAGR